MINAKPILKNVSVLYDAVKQPSYDQGNVVSTNDCDTDHQDRWDEALRWQKLYEYLTGSYIVGHDTIYSRQFILSMMQINYYIKFV